MTWTPLGRDALLDRTDDPFVRYAAPPDALAVAGPDGWACLLRWRVHGHWGGGAFAAPGAPDDAGTRAFAALTELAASRGVVPEWFSTTDDRSLGMPDGLVEAGSGRWAFMWTTDAAGLPAAPEGLVELDDTRDAEAIQHFGVTHNADFEGFPGHGYATAWLGVRDAGGLAAVGALHALASGAPHLSGIVVRPDLRGRGLGVALTAELTRWAVAGTGVATLGVYSANTVALGLYRRLGYAVAHHLHTRELARAPGR